MEFHPLYLVAVTGAGHAPVASRLGASGGLFSARGLNVRFWGHTEPPFAFYSESFFGIRREGGGETPMQLLLEGGAGEAGSRSKEAKSNAISDRVLRRVKGVFDFVVGIMQRNVGVKGLGPSLV